MDTHDFLKKLILSETSFNYHIRKTKKPFGCLIYIIDKSLMDYNNDKNLKTLEFTLTSIAEDLLKTNDIIVEKFAPSVFWTDEKDIKVLKSKLNNIDNFSESVDFSKFVNDIKDQYRILEIKDSLMYKYDPKKYELNQQKNYESNQKDLFDKIISQAKAKQDKYDEKILSYNNNLINLMKDYFKEVIENKRLNIDQEIYKFIMNFIDKDTWLKINDKPFDGDIRIIEFDTNNIKLFLCDDNLSYIADLTFEKTKFVSNNFKRLNDYDNPKSLYDYDFLIKLFDIDNDYNTDWYFKDADEKMEFVINEILNIKDNDDDNDVVVNIEHVELLNDFIKYMSQIGITIDNKKAIDFLKKRNN